VLWTPELSDIETPAVVVHEARLKENIRAMQATARLHGLALRPHVKTHKCLKIACMQLAGGAVGLTASKVDEALVFLDAGCHDVTVAYPVLDPAKLDRLLAAARRQGATLCCIADSFEACEALDAAARRNTARLGVFLKIDVGLHRCGMDENDARLLPLARRIAEGEGTRLAGLLSHAGQAYGAPDAAAVRDIARQEAAILCRVRAKLETAGLAVPTVSVGATPTALAVEAPGAYRGIDELRPGNYVFLDRTALRLGLAGPQRVALHVLATVVSTNERYAIIDAGAKTLGLDLGAHGFGAADYGYGLAFLPVNGQEDPTAAEALRVVRLSEEHGFLDRTGRDIRIGTRVLILPNHSCVVANLAERLVVVKEQGALTTWEVAARAKVR